jgi:hypothetical protein
VILLKIVVKSLGDNSPVEGDSLYIKSSGPIVDVNNNHAHKNNRPVKIRLKGVQPVLTAPIIRIIMVMERSISLL